MWVWIKASIDNSAIIVKLPLTPKLIVIKWCCYLQASQPMAEQLSNESCAATGWNAYYQVHDAVGNLGQWHCSFQMKAELPLAKVFCQQHNIGANLQANGSAAFIWKLHCHWLKGLHQCHVISVRQLSQHRIFEKKMTFLTLHHNKNFGCFQSDCYLHCHSMHEMEHASKRDQRNVVQFSCPAGWTMQCKLKFTGTHGVQILIFVSTQSELELK